MRRSSIHFAILTAAAALMLPAITAVPARAQGKLDATLYRHARGRSGRQGRLGHRHRRGSVHRRHERHDDRPVAHVRQRAGHRDDHAAMSPTAICCPSTYAMTRWSTKRARSCASRYRLASSRNSHRAATAAEPGPHSGHRRAPPRRDRSDDGVAGAGSRQRRSDDGGGLRAHHVGVRWAHALRSQARRSSASRTSRPTRAMPGRPWSARSISRRSPATSRTAPRSNI